MPYEGDGFESAEDVDDFRKISPLVCSIYLEQMQTHIFNAAEGAAGGAKRRPGCSYPGLLIL